MTLATPHPKPFIDGTIHMILGMIGSGRPVQIHAPGIIELGHFNPEHEWMIGKWWDLDDKYPELFGWEAGEGRIPTTAVVDTIEQWQGLFGESLEAFEHPVAAFFTHIPKEDDGGWRWHKWGEYLGEGEPSREYLADEEGFENGVYVVHLHPVTD